MVLSLPFVSAADVDPGVLAALEDHPEASVIVVLKDEPVGSPEEKKEMIQKVQESVLSNLQEKSGDPAAGLKGVVNNILGKEDHDIEVEHTYSTINGFSGDVTEQGLEKLKDDPNVEAVYLNKVRRVLLSDSVPLINADDTWQMNVGNYNITGQGQTVCVVDTGVDYTHPALGGCTNSSFLMGDCPKVIGGYDFTTCEEFNSASGNCIVPKNTDADPIDDAGHGTHVAGIVASTDSTYRGVAPEAKLVAMKVCNKQGMCSDSDVIAGVERCLNNATIYNISVVSISLGGDSYTSFCDASSPFSEIINTLVGKNISVVTAAGNSGGGSITDPSCVQNATRVTATTKSDSIPSYASRHAFFNDTIAAPGHLIKSLNLGGGFTSLSGTSMSTPHVSGVIALMRQYWSLTYNKSPTPEQIEQKILLTGKKIYDSVTNMDYPRIDTLALLQPVISFINPENNSVLSDNSFQVVISSDVDLASAVLELVFPDSSVTNLTMVNEISTQFSSNLSSLGDGTYTYLAFGTDSGGLVGVSPIQSLIIDTTSPSVTITAPANGTYIGGDVQSFTAAISESNLDSVIFSFDNSTGNDFNLTPVNTSGSWNVDVSISSLVEGEHLMTVIAVDLAGNSNASEHIQFSVDKSAPSVTFLSPVSGSVFTVDSGSQIFNASVNDNLPVGTVIFLFDNANALDFNLTAVFDNLSNTWSASYNVSTLLDGEHAVTVFAEDSAGNIDNNVSVSFTVDNAAPAVTFLSPSSGSVFTLASDTQTFNVSVNDSLLLVETVLFMFDNASSLDFNVTAVYDTSSNTWSVQYNVSTLMEGSHIVTASARDSAGNENRSESVTFTVDLATKPSVSLTSPADNVKSSNNTITFVCSAQDNLDLASITIYGNWSSWHANETHPITGSKNSTEFTKILPDGAHRWTCFAEDSESYAAFASQNYTLLIDTAPPQVSAIVAGSLTENSAEITWATDEDTNSTLAYGTTTAPDTFSSSNSLVKSHSLSVGSLSASTIYHYTVTSCDSFGNCATSNLNNFTTAAAAGGSGDSGDSGSGGSGSSGGGGGGGGSGGSSSAPSSPSDSTTEVSISGTEDASQPEIQESLEEILPAEVPAEETVELQGQEQEEAEQEALNLNSDDENTAALAENGFGSLITGFFSALVPSDANTKKYVASFVGALVLITATVLFLVHRRGKVDEFADGDEDEDEDGDEDQDRRIHYRERLP